MRHLLRRPLYTPDFCGVDTEALAISMENKMEDFLLSLRQHSSNFIDNVCEYSQNKLLFFGDFEDIFSHYLHIFLLIHVQYLITLNLSIKARNVYLCVILLV